MILQWLQSPSGIGFHLHLLEAWPVKFAKIPFSYLEEEKTERRKQVLL